MACVAVWTSFWRVSPSKFGFHGVCRLLSSFSWRVSPYNLVSMACVAFNLVFMACVAVLLSFWRVSPSKFVFMACVAF